MTATDVGIFVANRNPAICPDMLLSLDVAWNADRGTAAGRSYLLWDMGKPPELVVEIVSHTTNKEDTTKLTKYARMGVAVYLVYDPSGYLGEPPLRCYRRADDKLLRSDDLRFPFLNLGAVIWTGDYLDFHADWLRWTDAAGHLIPTGAELAAERARQLVAAREETRDEFIRAEGERQRADRLDREREAERQRAERLAEKLRQLGIDPSEGV